MATVQAQFGELKKNRLMSIPMNEKEVQMFTKFCEEKGVTKSGIVRSMVYSLLEGEDG